MYKSHFRLVGPIPGCRCIVSSSSSNDPPRRATGGEGRQRSLRDWRSLNCSPHSFTVIALRRRKGVHLAHGMMRKEGERPASVHARRPRLSTLSSLSSWTGRSVRPRLTKRSLLLNTHSATDKRRGDDSVRCLAETTEPMSPGSLRAGPVASVALASLARAEKRCHRVKNAFAITQGRTVRCKGAVATHGRGLGALRPRHAPFGQLEPQGSSV